jgi:hypothetical protein
MTTVALILWPLVGVAFFRFLGFQAAIAATIIGGYLLLPSRGGFDLPLLPSVNKDFVASVTALVLAMAFMATSGAAYRPGWLPRSPVILGLIGLLVVGGIGTVLTNKDPVFTGAAVLAGLRLYDAGSMTMNLAVSLLPFLLARKFFATAESHRTLLAVLAVAGAGYALLALYEIRMSPQLNSMVYGYFGHDWMQHLRDGGFRPVVFLYHALSLAIFLSCACLAAFGVWRIGGTKWRPWFLFAGLGILVTVVLAKNFGAIAITALLLPVVLLLPFRMQILAAAAVATVLTVYPVLRTSGLAPTGWVVETVRTIAPGREGSFEYRLRMEDALLDKALEKPLFGWGGWGRARVYDEQGRDTTVTDGQWIILFSNGGWFQYVGALGLLTYAVFALAVRWRRYELDPATAVLSVVLAANLIDLIPNATQTSITLLLAGALAGRLELERSKSGAPSAGRDGAADGRPENGRVRPSRAGGGRMRPAVALGMASGIEGKAAAASPFTRFAAKPGRNT